MNHRAAVPTAQSLQPPANIMQGLQALSDIVQGRASRQRASRRRQCIADVVPAGQWQANLRLPGGDDQAETVGDRIQNPRADRRRSIQTEIDDPSAWIQPNPIVGMGIVAVDDGHPGRAQSLENLALGARHAGHVAEPFQMTGTGIVDDRHVRPSQSGQIGDLAMMVGAHLDHRIAMFRIQAQQGQRHADIVVEVALGGQGRSTLS